MPIRFQNNQLIHSNHVGNFAGATSFTWSIRLLVNSVSGWDETPFFTGWAYQMFSLRFAQASASGVKVSVGVTRASGHLNSAAVAVPVGRPCSLIGTYNGTTLRLFINGYQAATISGASEPVTGTGKFTVGAEAYPGVARDYLLGDIRVWRNTVLTAQQIRELRDGVSFTTDPGVPFFAWTLDGTDGANVTTAAPGIRDTGVFAATVSAPSPVFNGTSLVYSPYVRVRDAQVGPSGKTLVLNFEDAYSGTVVRPSALVATPMLSVDGAAVDLGTPGPLWRANSLPYVAYPLPVAIPPEAVVRFAAPVGWALAGNLGEVRSESDRVVANPGPAILPPPPVGPRTMKLGWNVSGPYFWAPVAAYANLLKQAKREFAVSSGTPVVTYDPVTRFPSDVQGGELLCRLALFGYAAHDPRGYPNLPSGEYVLLWDGTGDARLGQENVGHAFSQTSASTGGTVNKRRDYRFTLSTNPSHPRGAQFRLVVSGQIANIRVFGPGTPTDGSAKFHPDYVRMLAGSRVIRYMDATVTNSSPLAHYEDLITPAQFTHDHTPAFKVLSAPLVSIGPYENPGGFFFTNSSALMLVTTATPHGFTTGQPVKFVSLEGGAGGQGRLRLVNGTDVNLVQITSFAAAPCRVVSPTSFAIAIGVGPATGAVAQPDGTQTFTGSARVEITAGMPFTDCVELANLVGADPWICVPHAFTDVATALLAADMVSELAPGRRMYVEYSNECWNFAPQFQQSYYVHGMAAASGLADSQWYAKRAGEIHAIFAAAFAAAGRPGDLIRVFGSQSANLAVTTTIANYCAAQGIPIDVVAIAPYFQNSPWTTPERWLALDVDQLHDLSDLALLSARGMVAGHKAALAGSHPAAKVACYEGGMEMGVPALSYGSETNRNQAGTLSRAWVRHPRIRSTVLRYCQQLEEEGCDVFAYYMLAGPLGNYNGINGGAVWAAHQRTDEPSGMGDGSDGLFDNRTDPQDMSQVVSVVGKAVQEWLALTQDEKDEEQDGPANANSPPRPFPPGLFQRIRDARPRPRRSRWLGGR